MNAAITTLPLEAMRYKTLGDYSIREGTLSVTVADMGDERYNFLVAIHELVEEFLTRQRGISEESITEFDVAFEAERERGARAEEDEPGDDPHSPYRREHRFAENIERMLAHELGVDWEKYGEAAMITLYGHRPLRHCRS